MTHIVIDTNKIFSMLILENSIIRFCTGHFFKMIGNMSLLRRFFVLGRRYGYKYITATRFIRKFRYGKPRQGCNIYRKSPPISPNQPR